MSTNLAPLFDTAFAEDDNIRNLQADGFQVGFRCRANGATGSCTAPQPVAYYWAAFGPHLPQVNYRSIGTAADLVDQGTITVAADSPAVTKTGGTGWRAGNRGRGDRLTVGTDHYVIASVASDDALTLATPALTGYTGATYTIARQFTTLAALGGLRVAVGREHCKRLTDTQEYFPTTSSSLVADDRREIGIAYEDSRSCTRTAGRAVRRWRADRRF